MDPFLVIPDEGGRRQSLQGKKCWTIGRGGDNDIVIDNRWISRHHAMFQKLESGSVYLVDLGSRNGSQINGQRVVTPALLCNGDNLILGRVSVKFYAPAQPNSSGEEKPDLLNPIGEVTQVDPARMGTQRKSRLISTVVVDIRGFTVLARTLDNHLLSEMIAAFHARAHDIVRRHGSWGGKSTGDGQMAIWAHDDEVVGDDSVQGLQETPGSGTHGCGIPGPVDHQFARLFKAILGIAELTETLDQEFSLPAPVRIGVGVNTGYAVVADAGPGDQLDFSVLGDAVNAAFRLESTTRQIGADLVIGQGTYYRLFPPALPFSASIPVPVKTPFIRHVVNLKGYDEPQAAYACFFSDLRALLKCVAE